MSIESPDTVSPLIPDSHFENLRELERGYWWYRGKVEWAKKLIRNWQRHSSPTELRYIDVGCGTGGFACEMIQTFHPSKNALFDSSTVALNKLKQDPQFEIIEQDIETKFNVPWQPSLITCMDVLEHLERDEALLERLAKSLLPGGLLVVSVPAHQFLYSAWDRSLGHKRRYSKRNLNHKLTNAGLTVREISYAWSFLAPLAPYRWLTPRTQAHVEFPHVSPTTNRVLIELARWERKLAQWIPLPIGTSIIASATKINGTHLPKGMALLLAYEKPSRRRF